MKPYYQDDSVTLYHGHALKVARELPSGAADCIVTSPPYFGLREPQHPVVGQHSPQLGDYGEPDQYGLEKSPAEYVENQRVLFDPAGHDATWRVILAVLSGVDSPMAVRAWTHDGSDGWPIGG